MARQVWLLRHAEAEPHGSRASDGDRRLTERGEAQSRAAGVALARIGARFEAVLFSPKVRARQTAEIAAEEWDEDQRAGLRVHEPLAQAFGPEDALALAGETSADGRILLVGHEPDLSGVVAGLAGARVDIKKGGLAVLRLEGTSGELSILLRPREIALIAGVPAGVV